jgi:hypothetical protein
MKTISLRPYSGEIRYFIRLKKFQKYYTQLTGDEYIWNDDIEGGRFFALTKDSDGSPLYLIYAKSPDVLVHELTHCLLLQWELQGMKPKSGKGEAFCYMLGQLVKECLE